MEEQFNQWFDSDIVQMDFVVKGSTVRDIALAAWTKSHEETLARLSTLGSVLTCDSGVTQKYELPPCSEQTTVTVGAVMTLADAQPNLNSIDGQST